MATNFAESVIQMTADNDTVAGPKDIKAIKVIAGGAGGLTQLKQSDTSGTVMYETTQAADAETFEQVNMKIGNGETLHLDTVDATVWLYLG